MILTTTDTIEGRKITAYLGIIAADSMMGTNMFRDMFAKVRDVVGGRVGSYEKVFAEAKQEALKDLEEKAKALGADAVVGVDLDYEILGADEKTMLHVSANGTAVKLG